MRSRTDYKASLALLGMVLASSTVPLFLKYFTGYLDGWTVNGMRYPVAALIYLPWLIHQRRAGNLSAKLWKLAILPSLFNVIGQTFFAWTLYFIDTNLMSFLVRLSTLWSVVGSFILFYDERRLVRSTKFWIGFIIMILGFLMIILGGRYTFGKTTIIGIILVFFCGITWAGYQLTVQRNLGRTDSRTAFGIVSFLTSLGLIGMMFTLGKPGEILLVPLPIIGVIILSGFIGIALAHLLLYFSMKRLGVAICSSISLSGAFITAFFSWIFFSEKLTPLQWASGGLIVLGGILLIQSQRVLSVVEN